MQSKSAALILQNLMHDEYLRFLVSYFIKASGPFLNPCLTDETEYKNISFWGATYIKMIRPGGGDAQFNLPIGYIWVNLSVWEYSKTASLLVSFYGELFSLWATRNTQLHLDKVWYDITQYNDFIIQELGAVVTSAKIGGWKTPPPPLISKSKKFD